MPLNLKVKLLREIAAPIRATPGSAGFDLVCPSRIKVFHGGLAQEIAEDDTVLREFDKGLVPLGFSTSFEKGFAGMVLPRSGLGSKFGLSLRNTVGLIDSDYPDEWMGAFKCDLRQGYYVVEKGTVLAQVAFVAVEMPETIQVQAFGAEEFAEAPGCKPDEREGGFGSTS